MQLLDLQPYLRAPPRTYVLTCSASATGTIDRLDSRLTSAVGGQVILWATAKVRRKGKTVP